MNTKLTLTIEKKVIQKAKKYAQQNGRSLSGIIENYLRIVTKTDDIEPREISPLVKSLQGAFSAPDHFDEKRELANRLSEKYL